MSRTREVDALGSCCSPRIFSDSLMGCLYRSMSRLSRSSLHVSHQLGSQTPNTMQPEWRFRDIPAAEQQRPLSQTAPSAKGPQKSPTWDIGAVVEGSIHVSRKGQLLQSP